MSISDDESINEKIDSLAAMPLCKTTLISANLFIGAKTNIIAVINDIKVPTLITLKYSAEVTINITPARKSATINWTRGMLTP